MKLLVLLFLTFIILRKLAKAIGTMVKTDYTSSSQDFSVAKDVTSYSESATTINHDLIVVENKEELLEGINTLSKNFDSFSLSKFISSAKKAILLLRKSLKQKDEKALTALVESSFIDTIKTMQDKIFEIEEGSVQNAKVEKIYSFNNKAFITLVLQYPLSKWTFSRHIKNLGKEWFISNVSV
ncbi:hypothetical protein [Candidatus Sneabacter namystus]|uniref:Tim44-like domain-containing protein n=1 Tax=Candidatus Sneabacter namystus TaxID=2601646 RepID=A0A5C0ULS2_9RICK|nr:hypothetical protein [Candidatus Sneabacter namystus]QEK39834.1 hypothetical protein FZC37_02785 [Candidatus Sneabacter namystus]